MADGAWVEGQGRAGDRIEPRHRARHRPGVRERGLRSAAHRAATRRRSKRSRRRSAAKGRKAAVVALDLRDRTAPRKRSSRRYEREFGGLDILVNNAGTTKRGDFFELTDADWEDGFALKFFAHVRLARAAWPLLKERRGSLVTIGGTSGRKPEASFTIGSSVNAAVAAFTKCLADLGKDDGVQVNCIHPSLVETERQWRRIRAEVERTGEAEETVRERFCREDRHHPLRQGRGRGRSRDASWCRRAPAGCTAPPSISTAARFRCCEVGLSVPMP